MRKAVLAATIMLLAGCALTPEQIKSVSTNFLCDQYTAPLSPQFLHPALKEELISRGADYCTKPEYINARLAAIQALGQASAVLQQNKPRQPQQTICTSSVVGNSVVTTCR